MCSARAHVAHTLPANAMLIPRLTGTSIPGASLRRP